MRPLAIAIAVLGSGALCATPALAKKKRQITPYIEIGQVVTADLNGGDVLTYSTVAAGVDASVQTRRVQVQIDYRYEHRFSVSNKLNNADVHSGLARADVKVVPGISLEGGALATRSRTDIRGDAPGILTGNVKNTSQVYSFYAGPSVRTDVGPLGLTANYRYGYTKVQSPGATGVDPTQPRLDIYDNSQNQLAQATLSLKQGLLLPVSTSISGAWERDDASQLAQRYDGKYARADVTWPVLPTLALTAGAGYEKIDISQRDPLRDSSGNPIVDSRGRFETDPSSPRKIAYNFDGIYYDAGVVWRPTSRTHLEVHVGKRYGSTSYTGTFTYAPTHSVAIAVNVYDGVTTFGRQLRDGIGSLPTSFNATSGGLGQDYNGCVFGAGGGGAGGCLNGVFQSISTSAFRARGVDAVASVSRGSLRFGVGAGYANRNFLAPQQQGSAFSIGGITDESYYAQAFVAEALDSRTVLDATVFTNYYNSGIANARGVLGVGGTASIGRSFGRLSARGSIGVYDFSQDNAKSVISADAMLGARYQF
jgi:hypothetical protein